MTTAKILSSLKWVLITCFALLLCFELLDAIAHHHFTFIKAKRMILLLALSAIFLFKNKYTYLIALVIFIYGMYNVLIVGTLASAPTEMEFTQSLHQLLNSQTNDDFSHRLIRIFPILFYFITFLAFATPAVRKWYGFASFKGKSQSNYLR